MAIRKQNHIGRSKAIHQPIPDKRIPKFGMPTGDFTALAAEPFLGSIGIATGRL